MQPSFWARSGAGMKGIRAFSLFGFKPLGATVRSGGECGRQRLLTQESRSVTNILPRRLKTSMALAGMVLLHGNPFRQK